MLFRRNNLWYTKYDFFKIISSWTCPGKTMKRPVWKSGLSPRQIYSEGKILLED